MFIIKKILILCFSLILCTELCFSDTSDVDVQTSSGLVRGQTLQVLNRSVNQFLGIPFAEPPIGELRFAKPKPLTEPIQGAIDGTKSKNSCIQPLTTVLNSNATLVQSEDCLVLNVWTTSLVNGSDEELKPVMFWIYGGGFSAGSIFQLPGYNGSILATYDVVFVSTNYRLGPLGFLYGGEDTAPGNAGLYDQLLALNWVRYNIHLFGGNKDMITMFGESAGSFAVSAFVLSPLTKGLFKRAIMESGAIFHNKERQFVSKNEALVKAKQIANALNCSDNNQWLDCLRKVNESEFRQFTGALTFPIEETEFLPMSSAQKAFSEQKFNNDLDMLAGVTKNEGSLLAYTIEPSIFTQNIITEMDFINWINESDKTFHNLDADRIAELYLEKVNRTDSETIKWAYFEFLGDIKIICPTFLFAEQYARHSPNSKVFFYELTYKAVNPQVLSCDSMGICHGSDLEFVFGEQLLHPNTSTQTDIDFSEEVMELWTHFAKYGNTTMEWAELIDKQYPTVTVVNELNPSRPYHYLFGVYGKCDNFWHDYFF